MSKLTTRPHVVLLGLAILVFHACTSGEGDREPGTELVAEPLRPYNVVLISIDTLRADHLSCYGYKGARTPHLDDFAKESTVFTQAHSQSPWTTPSHAALLTSLDPSALNMRRWPNPGQINPKVYTLAEFMGDQGYESAAFLEGEMLDSRFGFAQGFRPYRQEFSHIHESVPECLAWMRERLDQPFFVFLHTYDVHRYDPPEGFAHHLMPDYEGSVEKGIQLLRMLQRHNNSELLGRLNSADRKKIISLYDEALVYVDHWMGVFFSGLEEMGLFKNTIVILTSDHGEEFWEHVALGMVTPISRKC